jgi:hypothetical protein
VDSVPDPAHMPGRRQEPGFEQKGAKDTKGSEQESAEVAEANRESTNPRMGREIDANELHCGKVPGLEQEGAEGAEDVDSVPDPAHMAGRRQEPGFEQKGAKDTKGSEQGATENTESIEKEFSGILTGGR